MQVECKVLDESQWNSLAYEAYDETSVLNKSLKFLASLVNCTCLGGHVNILLVKAAHDRHG